nr:hypothetical protein [Tanacetum cinerariifolium]
MNQQREQEALLAPQREQELREQEQAAQKKEKPPQKELYCMHNDVDDLIERTLNSKLLSINLKSQHLDKEKQESSISLNNTPQISSVIAIALDLPTEEPEYSLSLGDEHLSTILEIESDEVIKSSVENLVPIPSEFEVTSDNENTLIDSSLKFDFLEEFSGELVHIDPIPPGIEEVDFDLEEEIRLVENSLYDNSSPRPPEEIDLFLDTDDLMPPSIENDDYDSKGDIHFLEELLSNDTLPFHENKSSNFDHHEICFDFEPDTGALTAKVVEDIFEHYDKATSDFFENPMMMYGGDILLLDIPIAPDLEASRARGFVQSSTRASIFSIWESDIRDLTDLTFKLLA